MTPKTNTPKSGWNRRAFLKSAAAGVLGTAFLPACDMLQENPASFVSPPNFYKDAGDAVAAVNGAYEPLAISEDYYARDFWITLDATTDIARISPQSGNVATRSLSRFNSSFNASNGKIHDWWEYAYRSITRANIVIARVPEIDMDPARRASVIGEAQFLRALNYFLLVRCFGAVPLILEEVDASQDLTVPRTPPEEVYRQIIADAEAAAGSLPGSWGEADEGRATKGAALTLLAAVHLTRQEWAQARDRAREVIDLGVYSLFPDYLDAFLPGTKNGREHVFSIQFTGENGLGMNVVQDMYPRELGPRQGGGFGTVQPNTWHYDSYEDGDYRKEVSYFTEGIDPDGNPVTFYPHIYKFRPTNPEQIKDGDVNWPVFRYAEVLLIYAEAVNETSGPTGEAYAAINQVRERAKLAPLTGLGQSQFREAVFRERQWELAHECKRRFDLIRRGPEFFVEAVRAHSPQGDEFVQPYHALYPLPQSELNINPELTQNPGYAPGW